MDRIAFNTIFPEPVYSISLGPIVFLDVPWTALSPEHEELLFKILSSVHLSPNEVQIVHQPTFDLSMWKEKPVQLIAFAHPPPGVMLYELIQTSETSMVVSEPLSELFNNEPNKRKLWNALKALFSC